MINNNTSLEEYASTIKHCAGIVAFRENNNDYEILLVKHTDKAQIQTGKCGLPAGAIEYCETPIEAAIREGKQESGINFFENQSEEILILDGLIPINKNPKPTLYHIVLALDYQGKIKRGDDDKTQPFWHRVKTLDNLDLVSPDIEYIANTALYIYKSTKEKRFDYDNNHRLYLPKSYLKPITLL